MCRDITSTLHKTMAKSFLTEFASRLNVKVGNQDLEETKAQVMQAEMSSKAATQQAVASQQNEPSVSATEVQNPSVTQKSVVQSQSVIPPTVQQSSKPDSAGKPQMEDFSLDDPKLFQKQLRNLATVTPQDINMHKRQKNGQLRIGDVICLSFLEEIHTEALKDATFQAAFDAMPKNVFDFKPKQKAQRILDEPDFKYKGLLFSDGVTDMGIKVLPKRNEMTNNASSLFKQCLFRIEIKQGCDINIKGHELREKLAEIKLTLEKTIEENGGEDNVNQKILQDLKAEIDRIDKEIDQNDMRKIEQDENNRYEQQLQVGKKLTYGQPVQFKHVFSGNYLTVNFKLMSQEYGCCQMYLSETTKESWFTIEPTFNMIKRGQVINYKDFFYIKSLTSTTPFYFHVFKKPTEDYRDDKYFLLNASQRASSLKAKLFMSHIDSEKEKEFIQSGDVIRIKHLEANGYLTTSAVSIEEVLPSFPDFLRGQIKRMYLGEKIEMQKGGKEKSSLTPQEKLDIMSDNQAFVFDYVMVTDEYVKTLRGKSSETVYVEHNSERLYFTNSCWEIQRVNAFKGGNLILDEVYRLRHVGTGKYLSVSDDRSELILRVTANSLATLFIFKSEMQTKVGSKYLDADDHQVYIDPKKFLRSGQRVMIQSYFEQKYLQLFEELESKDFTQFEHKRYHIDDMFQSLHQQKESQLRIINHTYQDVLKHKMIFQIEEVDQEQTLYTYKSGCIFDELLEFYAFLNVWGVSFIEGEETTEKYYLNHEKAIDLTDELFDKCEKAKYILDNIEILLKSAEGNDNKLLKCKKELVEQGILDILCKILEMLYYKTTPTPLFMKPFINRKSVNPTQKQNENPTGMEDKDEEIDIHNVKVEVYVAQEIAREQTHEVCYKVYQIILELIRAFRINSERSTKYFPIFYQHLTINQVWIELSLYNRSIYADNCQSYINIIGEIFRRAQKNSVYVSGDRSSNAIVEYNRKKNLKLLANNSPQKKPKRAHLKQQHHIAIDSRAANENIEKSNNTNQVQKWLDLLEPVRFLDENNQNIDKQIMYLNVISMFCRNKEGEGVYPYQMQVVQSIFEREENIPLKFGTAKVGNVLRPFVYFVRPKAAMSVGTFIENNPILGELQDNFKMTQTTATEYELIFDMHELSKSYDAKGKETWPYVDYIAAVISFYAHMCLSCNQRAIKCIQETGIDESHILCCISQDNERLVIHEKLKQMYMFLTRVMHIQNDPIAPGISNKNRCYVWERLKEPSDEGFKEEEVFNENSEDDMNLIENDFYFGLRKKRKHQMDDPNNSMIVLRYEQNSKDLGLIRLIKKEVIWFLQVGPQGSDAFFYHHHKRTFHQENLKTKVKSLKIYLDTLYALISEDCVDAKFIQNVQYICQCAIMGAKYMDPSQEEHVPPIVKGTWVYILMWLAKDIILKQSSSRQMKNAIKAVEIKVLKILDKLTDYRLNLQLHLFLMMFRRFQENNLDPHVSNEKSLELHVEFQKLFDIHQFDTGFKMSDIYIYQRIQEYQQVEKLDRNKKPNNKFIIDPSDYEPKDLNEFRLNKRIPFDLFLMDYIFSNGNSYDIRIKALQVLIKNFNQRDHLIKELARTDLIVSKDDYDIYFTFLQQQRQLKQLTNKLIQDEMFHMVYNKSPSLETKNTKIDIINILSNMTTELQQADDLQLKKLQNMLRHINLIDDLVNVLLKRLIFKEMFYRDLFQNVVDFLFVVCYQNPNCQKYMLPELNFFLDMMNQRIETGMLISEVIKSNTDVEYGKNFIKYLINKIFNEGYFKSTLFKQLIRMAENLQQQQDDSNVTYDDQRPENSNQQFILKQIIKNEKFRALLMMKREDTEMKLGIIKTYCKKKEQYNLSKKEEDASLKQDKEQLELHLAIVDLIAACARNSSFGIAQAQKLIDVEELLDSLLSDAIPYLVKKHYFNLLYEIYLRKVPGFDKSNRLQITDEKYIHIMKWVVLFDFQHCYNYYTGIIVDSNYRDPPEVTRKIKQVVREIERASEKEYDDLNSGKTEKDKDDERKYKQGLSSFKSQPFYVLDTNDQSEFWRYMFEYNKAERTYDGILCFIERFYRDYDVKDLSDDDLQDITVKIRDRLLAVANQIFIFIESHEGYIKSDIFGLLREINKTVQRIPHIRAFRAGTKRVIIDGKQVVVPNEEGAANDDDLVDESRDLDNRMCGEKIIRILRDYIMKENLHIKGAFGIVDITTDHYIDRDIMKDRIKAITGQESSFEEIMKALDHFQKVASDKKKEKSAIEVNKPGTEGFILNRNEAANTKTSDLIKQNKINFRDLEVQLKDVLKKQGYKAPNQQRERGDAQEMLLPNITENDLSIAINIDLKLFTQRFFEFVHMTKNVSEIHDFVNKLMHSEEINSSKESQVQLIRNLCGCIIGLDGIDDELILISILTIMLQRIMPEKDELIEQQDSEIQKTIFKKKNDALKQKLRQTQEVFFEAGVPLLMLSFINVEQDNFLSNKALNLLNCIMFKASEQMQLKILALLKKDDLYFKMFFYLKKRLNLSKTYLLQKIMLNAKQKFIDCRMKPQEGQISLSNDFKSQKIYMSQKYDLEYKYEELQIIWQQDEITTLLTFLNSMCEGCFRESQLYLRNQIEDNRENFKDNKQGKITSIDLIYETVTQFIDIVETLGKFVFSDFRTYKLVPFLLDTITEFIYGPNIDNQMFLGRWKRFIQKIDFLMQLDEMGNYSGIHQEAKAQLKILFACSNMLLAIIDIKDKEKATEIHKIVLAEVDVSNLMKKMVDIYLFKIGGSKTKRQIYKFNMICNHYKSKSVKEGENHCLEDEFCQHGHLISRDRETIQTGFNIYQILQIFRKSLPGHPKLEFLEVEQKKYDFLWKDYDMYYKNIYLEVNSSYLARSTFDIYRRFDQNEKKLLDQLIIKCFPDVYIRYLEDMTRKTDIDDIKKKELLIQVINMTKEKKTLEDQSKMLQKVQEKIRQDIENEIEQIEYKKIIEIIETHGDDEHEPLWNEYMKGNSGGYQELEKAATGGFLSRFKKKKDEEEIAKTQSQFQEDKDFKRKEFQEKLKLFKYYLAVDFYEDNIGKVEILQGEEIIEATFKMPAFVNLLPPMSRKGIPRIIFKVSQQEKLEAFMSNVPLLREEMLWQQKLGQQSMVLKMFANRYFELSYINFTMIVFVNCLFLWTLEYDEQVMVRFENSQQKRFVEGMSIIQTSIAFMVMFSYYIQQRAKFVYLLKIEDSTIKSKRTKGIKGTIEKIKKILAKSSDLVHKPTEQGKNYGSQGFGQARAEKPQTNMNNISMISSIVKLSQNNVLVEAFLLLLHEAVIFVRSIFIDFDHWQHIFYVLISILSVTSNLFNALLLIDIIKKIPSLKDIIYILGENFDQIVSTLALFLVALYIFAFYAFNNFPDAFENDPDPGSPHAAAFQMYCDNLQNCLLSTINVGIRSGGGLGENLSQAKFDDLSNYRLRYIFDLGFFLVINIVLLNIFFGIIIDAFADKRAVNAEKDLEMRNQCFICGISKSKFDIENIPWKEHIYQQHNMHAYLAFVLYVQQKPSSECTGVEKFVKQRIQNNSVDFFPVQRCLAINGGELIE